MLYSQTKIIIYESHFCARSGSEKTYIIQIHDKYCIVGSMKSGNYRDSTI